MNDITQFLPSSRFSHILLSILSPNTAIYGEQMIVIICFCIVLFLSTRSCMVSSFKFCSLLRQDAPIICHICRRLHLGIWSARRTGQDHLWSSKFGHLFGYLRHRYTKSWNCDPAYCGIRRKHAERFTSRLGLTGANITETQSSGAVPLQFSVFRISSRRATTAYSSHNDRLPLDIRGSISSRAIMVLLVFALFEGTRALLGVPYNRGRQAVKTQHQLTLPRGVLNKTHMLRSTSVVITLTWHGLIDNGCVGRKLIVVRNFFPSSAEHSSYPVYTHPVLVMRRQGVR
jgi:hypothetical protein